MPKALKAGFPTYWTTYGQGPRPALMIHCSLAHSGSWAGVAGHLGDDLTMTAFDIPGHGRSADWDNRGEIQAVTAGIAAEFLDEPADVIGHSFGATVALRLAVERPELARSLVLIEPVFFAVAWQDDPGLRARYGDFVETYDRAMRARDYLAAAREFIRLWGDGTPWSGIPSQQQALLAKQVPLVEAAAPAIHEDIAGLLKTGRLERLAVPVLLIEGSESPGAIRAINDGLAARLPDTKRATVPGAGHMAPVTHAREVADEIRQFLHEV